MDLWGIQDEDYDVHMFENVASSMNECKILDVRRDEGLKNKTEERFDVEEDE